MKEVQKQGNHRRDERSEKDSLITFVKELESEKDAWITPVDAARITGASESMAHRWVSSGRLPIKGDPETQIPDLVGNPPRTRQVRLSDVAKLHVILYPEQVISPAIRTLDIQSIPLEVARITLDHERITRDHQQIVQQTSTLETTVKQEAMRLREDARLQEGQVRVALTALRTDAEHMLSASEERLSATQQQFRQDLEHLQTEAQQMEGRYQEAQETLRTELTHAQEEHKGQIQQSLDALSTTYQQALQAFQQTVNERLQQSEGSTEQRLREIEQRTGQETERLAERILALDERIATILTTAETVLEEHKKAVQGQLSGITDQLTLLRQDSERRWSEGERRYQGLNQRVAEHFSQYEQILPLIPHMATLQRLIAEGTAPTHVENDRHHKATE